jgi:hypothetical protein
MEIQSKTLDALLEKAEQVIRLLEVSDDTKCEPVISHRWLTNYELIMMVKEIHHRSSFVRISVMQWLKISTE